MNNLLATNLTLPELTRILSATPRRPLLPPLGSLVWRGVARKPAVAKWMPAIRARAEAEADEPLPVLTDELYADFHRSGTRLSFERVYFERRRRLARAAMCALLEEANPLGVRSLLRKLADVFAEKSWALPAHVENPTGQDPARIDLFAAETANLMAEMITLFDAGLPAELIRHIRERLRRDVWENYLANIESHTWTLTDNNWNAVCHQGVLGSALALEDDATLVARLLAQAARHLPRFLAGFTSDGGCTEGPAYWEYGFGWFSLLNEQLETRTDGQLSLFDGDERVRRIAGYGPLMTLANGGLVNFADCPPRGVLRPSLLQYLGERLDEPLCRAQAASNYRQLFESGLKLDANRSDLFYLTRLFLRCPGDLSSARPPATPDAFFPELGVIVCRAVSGSGSLWEFAAKAGHNGEHHNHNDCGSYLLNVGGERLILELGAPEYRRETFRAERYEMLPARTLGHSLPDINGCEQAAGREFAARVVRHEATEREVRFEVDLTRCYLSAAGCANCLRIFHFDKLSPALRLEDRFALHAPEKLETAVITDAEVSVEGSTALLKKSKIALRLVCDGETEIREVQIHTYRNLVGEAQKVRRIVLAPKKLALETKLGYTICNPR